MGMKDEKMVKIEKNPKMLTIVLMLTLTISVFSAVIPLTGAQDIAYTKTTHAYIGATPNPVGVNQEVLLHVGITDYLYVVTDGWEGLTVTVTKPDGTSDTLGPYRTDSTGGTGAVYVPTTVGTYTFQTHFPEQTYTWTTPPLFDPEFVGTVLYEQSDSEVLEVVVNEEQREWYIPSPTPSNYWTRPIDAQHRNWYTISGSWLEGSGRNGAFMPFNDYAPETAHILWAKPFEAGGLAGGTTGEHAYDCGDAYEGKFLGSVVIGGVLYYNKFEARPTTQEVVAVDLHTGETLWEKPLTTPDGNVVRLSMAQQLYHDGFNYHAVFDFLWAIETAGSFFDPVNIWHAFDPFTGEWMYSMENVPEMGIRFGASYTLRGPKGEILIYTIDLNNGWMALWNSTQVVYGQIGAGMDQGSFRPYSNIYDAMDGYMWNISFPTGLPGTLRFITENKAYGNDVSGWSNIGDNPINQWCVSLETGELLWENTWTPPPGELSITVGASSEDCGIYVMTAKETREMWGFDLETGQEIWGPTDPMPYLGIYGINTMIAYDKVIVAARMAGTVNAYDCETGNLLWSYAAVDPLGEMLWGNQWPIQAHFVTDGKVYLGHSEHSPVDPKPRGAPFICLDVETGNVIWRADGLFRQSDWGGQAIIGDSIIATQDTYDQRIYAIGKGPSQLTLEAPLTGIQLGSNVVLRGTVMDISPGTEDAPIKLRFPDGVPAVSDDSMSEWMKFVYKQFPQPMSTGVPVKLEVISDPNGNYYDIETTMTDSSGFYSVAWEPSVAGQYTILATFAGTEGYTSSYKMTSIVVDDAPTPAAPIEPEEPEPDEIVEPAETPMITTEIATIIGVAAVAIIAVVVFVLLRRRK
jgi:outer membrane protein assembly factor BamB